MLHRCSLYDGNHDARAAAFIMYVRPLLVAVVGISKAIMIVMMIAIIMLMNMVAMVVGASVNMAWLIAGMGVHEKAGEGTDRG